MSIIHPHSIPCGLCDANKAPIGSADQIVRVFTFGGSGFDTVVQLGATHALVVSEAAPPDVVIGISAGAVQAAAMAEVLKADEPVRKTSNNVELYREARMSRFREFLYECQEMPSRLRDSLLPDAYEADAGMALEPHHQASHEKKERDERQTSLRARSGVVYFFNTLAGLRITLATLTRFVRIYLGYKASSAYGMGRRWSTLASELTRLLRTVASHFVSTLQLMVTLGRAAVWGRWSGRLKGYAAGRIIFRETTKLRMVILAIMVVIVPWALLRFWQAATVARVLSHVPFLPGWVASALSEVQSHLTWWVTALLVVYAFLLAVAALWVLPRILYAVTFVAAALVYLVAPPLRNRISDGAMRRILDHFELGSDLGSAYFVRQTLVRLFDRDYYGKPDIREFVVRALTHKSSGTKEARPRTLREYAEGNRKIHVVPVAASLADGELVTLAPDDKIVDALEAATALPPFLRPVPIGTRTLIDGSSIANEPMAPARQLLRNRLHSEAGAVHIYPVSGLPVSRNELPRRRDENMTYDRPYTGLIDVVFRVRQLQSFRTAKLDREITELYARMIPPERQPPELLRPSPRKGKNPPQPPRALRCFGKEKHFVRAEIHPIEPEKYAVNLSSRLFRSRTRLDEQQAITETVATGCRMTLQSLCRDVVRKLADSDGTVDCATAMRERLGTAAPASSGSVTYPGAAEVCRHCHIVRNGKTLQQKLEVVQIGGENPPLQPVWPLDPLFHPTALPAAVTVEERKEAKETPLREEPIAEATRNLLFSGGVFRGVFLVGVLNGLHELRVKPTLLAGSSVGSITAAMAARVFSIAKDPKRSEKDRQTAAEKAVLDLAATYLVLDDLIVTDRFADFVRRFTLRAAEARFSPKDLDDVFRNYDRPGNRSFYNRSRRVVGGLEHLLYVSPFELLALLRSLRMQDARRSYRLIRRYFQEILDRGGVSLEVLGTEPLQVLIREHVLTAEQREQRSVAFDTFQQESGMAFLATTTNITAGALEIIGASLKGVRRDATLVDALLASSAFPGVFRPRWGWEVYVGENEQHNQQLVDGGVMDNLPLDAVVTYLNEQAEADPPRIPIRPPDAPHLIFTGSLERDPRVVGKRETSRIAGSWPAALRHAREHAYNRKIDEFAKVQREFRQITRMYENHATKQPWTPLDIEVIVAKPQWLCGTFAFHPMLGFRRDRQAASIAHGCATTLATFARYAVPGSVEQAHLDGWGIDNGVVGDMLEETIGSSRQPRLVPKRRGRGICHFRKNAPCPFASPVGFEKRVAEELKTIYDLCGKQSTHEAEK